LYCHAVHLCPPSFPTRRSSDLAVSDDISHGALRRSAWEFSDATTDGKPALRAGVGIRQKTGARAGGVLYDREVMPAGTRWELNRSEEHTSELQSRENLVCRLLL